MPENDEIDLFDLVETLWANKIIVTAVAALSVFLTSIYLVMTPPSYESRIAYRPFITPPFINDKKALSDFSASFLSEESFNKWRETRESSVITFNDISDKILLNGSLFMKTNSERIVVLIRPVRTKFDPYLSVKSNDVEILQALYSYAQHVNSHITKSYAERVREESALINKEMKMLTDQDRSLILSQLDYYRFIYNTDQGNNVLSIQRPTRPVKIWPKRAMLLFAATGLGLLAGIVICLITASYQKRGISKKHGAAQI